MGVSVDYFYDNFISFSNFMGLNIGGISKEIVRTISS